MSLVMTSLSKGFAAESARADSAVVSMAVFFISSAMILSSSF